MNLPVANQLTQEPLTPKMAPWPEPGTELKTSDRISTCHTTTNQSQDVTTVNSLTSEESADNAANNVDDKPQVDKKSAPGTEVTNLNDNQLKALLDEALTYKCPKDREGKSDLFRKLLDKAESDKLACGEVGHTDARSSGFRRYRGSRRDASAASTSETKGGSLQNLAQDSAEFEQLGASSGRGRKAKKGGIGVSVSARQREGGSLPSNVNVGGCGMRTPLLFEGYTKSKKKKEQEFPLQMEYHRPQLPDNSECVVISVNSGRYDIAPVRKSEVGDNGEAMECEDGTEMDVLTRNYTTRATLEVGHGDTGVEVEREVDAAVLFPINRSMVMENINGSDHRALQLSSSYNSVKSLTASDERIKPKAPGEAILFNDPKFASAQHVSELSITPAKRSPNWSTSALASADSGNRYVFSSPDDKSKSFDENGNAVNSLANNSDRRGKARKSKPKENYTKFVAEDVTGYQGDKDLESLLKFIESDKESKGKALRNAGHTPRSAAVATKGAKSRDRKLTKSEDNEKLKRSNSLEEISKTKLEDLTSESGGTVTRRPKKQSTFDETDRRSWGCTDPASADESVQVRKKRHETRDDIVLTQEETEFHIVTKKQRRKKRRSSSGGRDDGRRSQGSQPGQRDQQPRRGNNGGFPPHDRDVLYQYRRPRSPDMRRKSTSSMPPSDKSDSSDLDSVHSLPVSSTMDQATPLASYADIAKSSNATPANINVNATKWPPIQAQFITSSKINIGAPPVSGSRLHNSDETVDTKPRKKHPVPLISAPVNFKTIPLYQNDELDTLDSSNKFTKNSPALEDNYCSNNKNAAISDDNFGDDTQSDIADSHKQFSDDISVAKSDLSDNKSNTKVNPSLPKEGKTTNINKIVTSPLPASHPARPAVILLDEKESQNLTSEITFGFEINELLLMSDEEDDEDNADSFNSAYSTERVVEAHSEEEGPNLEAFILRYRAPQDVKLTPELEAVVNYIGCAWDDVSSQGGCVVWSDRL